MIQAPDAAQIRAARDALAAADPALARVDAVTPDFAWRLRPGGFAGLLRMIVEQQVSTASAAAIWARVEAGLDEVSAQAVLSRSEEALRGFGLSGPKARYAREIALAEESGLIDFDALPVMDDAQAMAALTAIKGVGAWTAQIYLMFCHGRADIFPAGDVALQEAMRWADRGQVRPDAKAAAVRAEMWRPHRSTSAHLLWAWYGGVKRGEIALQP